MATLTITFTPPSPAPAFGYIVHYRQAGQSAYSSIDVSGSPAVITGLVEGASYEGYIVSDCNGHGFVSDPVYFSATVDNVACGAGTSYSGGQTMPTEQIITLGSGLGVVTLDFEAYDIPDKFEVWYNGVKVIDTGYRGDSSYQTDLNNSVGPYNGTIQGTGHGTATFTKSMAFPTTALVKVYAPLSGTSWSFTLSCPVAS